MKRSIILTTALALIALYGVNAEEATTKPHGKGGPGRQGQMGLLPPKLVGDLNLTADQKTKYDDIETKFKTAAKTYRDGHPISDADREAMREAHKSGDKAAMAKYAEQRKGFMELRKGYVDQVRAILTPDQVKTLEEAKARLGEHRGKGKSDDDKE